MDITVLDSNFNNILLLDSYESFLWVDKFAEPGTFELVARINDDLLACIKPDNYIINSESEHVMIIEDISIESSIEEGGKLKAVGRSLESILDRRIVSTQTNVSGSLQNGLKTLMNSHIISPSTTDRRIPGFIFQDSTDTAITSLTMDHQFTGDNMLDVVTGVCAEAGIGFKITLNSSNQFVFQLYSGTDRSYSSSSGTYVVFSPKYDNLLSSTYIEKHSEFKNVALVAGDGTGTSRITQLVGSGEGLARKEIYIDVRGINQGSLSSANYKKKLASKGKDELAKIKRNSMYFDGECDTTRMYKYGVDFFMGDYVQIENEYGMGDKTRVTEFTWSHSTSGLETFPTFTKDNED